MLAGCSQDNAVENNTQQIKQEKNKYADQQRRYSRKNMVSHLVGGFREFVYAHTYSTRMHGSDFARLNVRDPQVKARGRTFNLIPGRHVLHTPFSVVEGAFSYRFCSVGRRRTKRGD
jgi:hypothetical protein